MDSPVVLQTPETCSEKENASSPDPEIEIVRPPPTQLTLTSHQLHRKNIFTKSLYARFFEIDESEVGDKTRLKCSVLIKDNKQCNQLITLQKDTYFNLKAHLKRAHGIDINSGIPTKGPVSDGRIQPTLSQFKDSKSKYPKNHQKQVQFDVTVLKLLAEDGTCLNIVNKKWFRQLVLTLDPRIRIKTRQGFMKKLNGIVEREVLPRRRSAFRNIEKRFCHFSCDIWSTKRNEGVLCILAHHINPDFWALQTTVLLFEAITEQHTAENIRSVFLKALSNYNVPSNWGGYVITDNASNMKKSFNLKDIGLDDNWSNYFEDKDDLDDDYSPENDNESDWETESESDNDDDEEEAIESEQSNQIFEQFSSDLFHSAAQLPISGHLSCAAHSLQLGINDGLRNDESAKRFLGYVSNIMKFFKISVRWRDELRKSTNLDPKLDGKTRWNSALDMLQRFQNESFFEGIRLVLTRASLSPRGSRQREVPSPPGLLEKQQAEELGVLLRPLGVATDRLQGDGPTSNIVVLSIVTAFKHLVSFTPQFFGGLKESLLIGLKKRMEPYIQREEYLLSAILDPRIKTSIWDLTWPENDEKYTLHFPTKQEGLRLLREKYAAEKALIQAVVTNQVNVGTVPDQTASSSSTGARDFGLFDLIRTRPTSLMMKEELDHYLEEQVSPEESCPLEYWKCNVKRFEVMSRLARKFLSIPATSAGVERVFSVAGAISNARRARMSTKTIASLLLYRSDKLDETKGIKRKNVE